MSCTLIAIAALFGSAAAQQSDVPKQFTNRELPQPYIRREAMVRMRDGVHLRTVLYLPKGAKGAPMMMERTPYNVDILAPRVETGPLFRAGYILVFQDTRGKYGSEGDYVVTRPVRGPLNPTTTDHSTDTWDTIDWLVKNVPSRTAGWA
jgi:predicted acyl esterase